MSEKVLVEVTDKGAIYVDETRISARSTKWGQHRIVASFTCSSSQVGTALVERGFQDLAQKIDAPVYVDQIWHPMTRTPSVRKMITCLGADGKEYSDLCYSSHRGCIIEPVTNRDAEPVIGPMRGWKYQKMETSTSKQRV